MSSPSWNSQNKESERKREREQRRQKWTLGKHLLCWDSDSSGSNGDNLLVNPIFSLSGTVDEASVKHSLWSGAAVTIAMVSKNLCLPPSPLCINVSHTLMQWNRNIPHSRAVKLTLWVVPVRAKLVTGMSCFCPQPTTFLCFPWVQRKEGGH